MRKLLWVALVAGCSTATTPSKYVDNDTIIPPTTKITDAETRNALTSFDTTSGTLTFSKSTALLDGLKVGDVLNSTFAPPAAPYGFLRKVTAISRSGGQVVVSSKQAALTDAIEKGSFHLSKPITMDDIKAFNPASASIKMSDSLHPDVLGLTLSFNNGLYIQFDHTSLSLGSTVNATISLNGYMRINPTFNVDVSINCFQVQRALFSAELEGDSNLDVGLQLGAAFDSKTTIFTTELTPIDIQAGPFAIVLVPTLSFFMGIDGNIEASISFHENNMTDGIAGESFVQNFDGLCNGDGGTWTNLNQGYSHGDIPSNVSFQLSGMLESYVRMEADVQFYGLANLGPYFYFNVGPQLNFQTPRHPFFEAGIHLKLGMGIELQLFGDDLTQIDLLGLDQLFPIFTSPNAPPILSVTSPGNGDNFGPTDPINFAAIVFDLEDGTNVQVDWSSDVDGPIGSGANLPGVTLNASTPGPRNITVTATDTDGLPSSSTFSITLTNPGASVVMSAPADNVGVADSTAIHLRGTATDPYNPAGDLCNNGYQFTWTSSHAGDTITPLSCFGSASSARLNLAADGQKDTPRTVTLTVTDPSNLGRSVLHTISPSPYPSFTSTTITSPTASSIYSANDSIPLNGSVTGDPDVKTSGEYSWVWSATSYAADGTTPVNTVDVGTMVEGSQIGGKGTGKQAPISFRPASIPGFLDPTLVSSPSGQTVRFSVTVLTSGPNILTGTATPVPVTVTP
jgi:hypothetical protein